MKPTVCRISPRNTIASTRPSSQSVFLGRGSFSYPGPQIGPLGHKSGPSTTLTRIASAIPKTVKTKPQVDSLSIFRKKPTMVDPCGLNVVDRPFSWHSTTPSQIGTPSPRELPTSCSPSALSARHSGNSTTVRTRKQRYTLLYLTILCYILLYFAISCYILSKGGSHANKPF